MVDFLCCLFKLLSVLIGFEQVFSLLISIFSTLIKFSTQAKIFQPINNDSQKRFSNVIERRENRKKIKTERTFYAIKCIQAWLLIDERSLNTL